MRLAGLHVVGTVTVVAPFLGALVLIVLAIIASVCVMPLQRVGVRYKS